MRCKKCGSENRDDAKFCRKCGEALDRQEPQSLAHERQAKNEQPRRHKPKFILIAAISVLLLTISGYIALTFKVKNAPVDGTAGSNANSAIHYSDNLYYDAPNENHFAEDVDTGIDYVDNEVVIYCEDGVPIGDVLYDSGVAAFEIVGHAAATGSYQVRLDKVMGYSEVLDLCNTIASAEGVVKCTPNFVFVAEPSERTNDPAWTEGTEKGKPSKTWGLESIKAPEAWDIVKASNDVHVGMLECSQFFTYHEDLDDAIVETLPSSDEQFDIKHGRGWLADEDDHGTHVAGIIGAESNSSGSVGVAYGASLYGYSCGGKDSNGNPKITDEYGLEVGLTYLIVYCDCDVVNISARWAGDVQKRASSGSGADAAAAQWEMQQYAAYCGDFIKALVREGYDDFIICKSADNEGTKGLANWDMFGCIADDEAASRILIVGSLMQTANGELAVSEHTDPPWASSCGSRVDVLAPGSDIYSTIYSTTDEGDASIPYSDYGYKSGTSMATPMASGVAALVKSANPELKGNQIKEIICETASGSYADKTGVSKGQIDAEAAVKRATKMVGLGSQGIPAAYEEVLRSNFGTIHYHQGYTANSSHYYALEDLDGNGTPELIISYGERDGDSRVVCSVWGIDTSGSAICLIDHAYRGGMQVLSNGTIWETSGSSAFDWHCRILRIEGASVEKVISIDHDGSVDNQDVGTYYTNLDEGVNAQLVEDSFYGDYTKSLEVREDFDWQEMSSSAAANTLEEGGSREEAPTSDGMQDHSRTADNAIDGTWVSTDGDWVFKLDFKGTAYVTAGGSTNLVTGGESEYVHLVDGQASDRYRGGIEYSEAGSILIKPYENSAESFTFEFENGRLKGSGFTLERVPDEIVRQFIGTWSGPKDAYVFKDNGQYTYEDGRESTWGFYYVISPSTIVLSNMSHSFRPYSYSLSGNHLTLQETIYARQGDGLDAEEATTLKNGLIGTWRVKGADTSTAEEYRFYTNGSFGRYLTSYRSGMESLSNEVLLEEGRYEFLNESTVRLYVSDYQYTDEEYDSTSKLFITQLLSSNPSRYQQSSWLVPRVG